MLIVVDKNKKVPTIKFTSTKAKHFIRFYKGIYELLRFKSFHSLTPLWCKRHFFNLPDCPRTNRKNLPIQPNLFLPSLSTVLLITEPTNLLLPLLLPSTHSFTLPEPKSLPSSSPYLKTLTLSMPDSNSILYLPPKDSPLNIFGLLFIIIKNSTLHLVNELESVADTLNIALKILDAYNLVNKKGFVPSKDPNPVLPLIYKYLKTSHTTRRIKDLGINENTYRLWYNFLLINLLLLVNRVIKHSEASLGVSLRENQDIEESDDLVDLKNLKLSLVSRIDPSIRVQVVKKGISIIQNTYNGFDSEYELIDYTKSKNKLVSFQTAQRSRTLLKIPLNYSYDISYVHPITSELTSYYKPHVED